jgi:hypothetical protein
MMEFTEITNNIKIVEKDIKNLQIKIKEIKKLKNN